MRINIFVYIVLMTLVSACSSGSYRADIKEGERLISEGRIVEALALSIPWAEAGDNEFQLAAAVLILTLLHNPEEFRDVPDSMNKYISMDTVIKFLELSASSGNDRAREVLEEIQRLMELQ